MTNKKLFIPVIVSLALLLIFEIIQILRPDFLKLELKWIIIAFVPMFIAILQSGLIRSLKVPGLEYESNIIEADTSKRDLSGESIPEELSKDKPRNVFPADYIYLNHTSFLRPEKQKDFQDITRVYDFPHYDIRVKVNSYYRNALERIKYVVYYLHKSYPKPIQACSNRQDNFELKEVANGEYVLTAEVFLKDVKEPIILTRYITLWESGPKI